MRVILLSTRLMKSLVGLPGRKPGIKPPFFFRLLAIFDGVELNGGIEVGKAQDEQEIDDDIRRAALLEGVEESVPESARRPES